MSEPTYEHVEDAAFNVDEGDILPFGEGAWLRVDEIEGRDGPRIQFTHRASDWTRTVAYCDFEWVPFLRSRG